MFIQYLSVLVVSTLLIAKTAVASHFEAFEIAGTSRLVGRQTTPADCPVDLPGSQTCDIPGSCYYPTQKVCCGEGNGVTCPVGYYCTATGCCPTGEVCRGAGGTLSTESTITNSNTVLGEDTSTNVIASTSTSTSHSTALVPSSGPATTSTSTTTSSSSSTPESAPSPTSSDVPLAAPVPTSADSTTTSATSQTATTPSAPAQFTGAAGRYAVGGIVALVAGGAVGLVGVL